MGWGLASWVLSLLSKKLQSLKGVFEVLWGLGKLCATCF